MLYLRCHHAVLQTEESKKTHISLSQKYQDKCWETQLLRAQGFPSEIKGMEHQTVVQSPVVLIAFLKVNFNNQKKVGDASREERHGALIKEAGYRHI